MQKTSDLRIAGRQEVVSASSLLSEQPISVISSETVFSARKEFSEILNKKDNRLAVVVGPCSIHDTDAAMEYANLLLAEKNNLKLIKHWCDGEPMTTFRWDNNKRKHCFLFKKVSALNEIQKINFKIKNHSNRKRIAVLKNIPFWLKKCNIKQVILACLDLLGISSLLLKLSRPFN